MGRYTYRPHRIESHYMNTSASLLIFSDIQGPAAQLATSAAARLLQGFRSSTFKQYTRMWSDFQAFKVAAGLLPSEVTVHILLAIMKYLSQNNQSKSTMSNYMTAIHAFHIIYACDTFPFKDERISWFQSLQITAPLTPRICTTLNIQYSRHLRWQLGCYPLR